GVDLGERTAGVEVAQAIIIDIIAGIHILVALALGIVAAGEFIGDLGLAGFTLFCRHEDDAVVGPGAIDRGGGGVAQQFDRGDIAGGDVVERGPDDAVDYDQGWGGGVDRRAAAQKDGRCPSRGAAGIDDLQTGHGALQRGGDVGDRRRPENGGVQFSYRAGDVAPYLRAITHDNDFIHFLGAGFQRYLDEGGLADADFGGLVAYGAKEQHLAGGGVDGEAAIGFCLCAAGPAFDGDAHVLKRFVIFARDPPRDRFRCPAGSIL